MNISEIRQQFPMYSDLPDGELVRGLHKKFYSDMQYADFLKKIDFRESVNPTEGMTGAQKFNAGVGKAFYDVGQGAAQLVGMGESGQETKDRRALDAPLMRTGAGVAGNVLGNVAAFAPLAVVPGANTVAGAGAIGATMGALQPAESFGERAANIGVGGVLGSGIQAAARYPQEVMEGVRSFVSAPFRAAGAAVEPFYQAGRDRILGRAIRDSVGPNAPQVQQNLRNAQPLVPNTLPTAAEVAQSPGLAALQRSAAAVDPESYANRVAQNNVARVEELRDIAGTGGQREFFAAARQNAADTLYTEAYQRGVDLRRNPTTGQFYTKAEIAGRKAEITKLLQRPAIQDAMEKARTLAANEGINMSNPAGSVQGLDYLQRALKDMAGAAPANEARILGDLRRRLLTTIDALSPRYADARNTFAQMSRPINQMDIAQEVADRSIHPLTGNIQPHAFARALSDDTAQRVTGMNNATLANQLEPQQLARMNAIRDDLARSVYAQNAGRGPGSDTVQKLAMTNLLQRSGMPMGVLNAPLLGRMGNWAYEVADRRMREQLANALLSPAETAALLRAAPPIPQLPARLPPQMLDRAALAARGLLLPPLVMDRN